MTAPLDELKVRARLLSKALAASVPEALARAEKIARRRRWSMPERCTLGLCLNLVAAELGFEHWEHARGVLGGNARRESDMGSFWYDDGCAMLLNHWFGRHAEARESLRLHDGRFLFPYRTQFIVAEAPFAVALGLDPAALEWISIGHDLAAGYGSPAWYALVLQRLRFTRGE